MKKAFSDFIVGAGTNKRVVLIAGDVGEGMCKEFASLYPARFFNIGVCEQSMVGIAAGLALQGMIPYIVTITPFLIERAFEQIKMDVDYMKANVKMVVYAHTRDAGLSHKCLDEKKLMSCFCNITQFYPDNAREAISAFKVAHSVIGPTYTSIK
jgi:transketolase